MSAYLLNTSWATQPCESTLPTRPHFKILIMVGKLVLYCTGVLASWIFVAIVSELVNYRAF